MREEADLRVRGDAVESGFDGGDDGDDLAQGESPRNARVRHEELRNSHARLVIEQSPFSLWSQR